MQKTEKIASQMANKCINNSEQLIKTDKLTAWSYLYLVSGSKESFTK